VNEVENDMQTITIGINGEKYLAEPLDTWLTAGQHDYAVPEAAGSSARVFHLKDATPNIVSQRRHDLAIKVMRHDKIAYATPLFKQELLILRGISGNPGFTPMMGCGFFKLDEPGLWPGEIAPMSKSMQSAASGRHLNGHLNQYEREETDVMLQEFDERVAAGWLPYLLLERRWEDNLYLLCDAGYTRGAFLKNLTIVQVLKIAIQICDLLSMAHARGAVYNDHKLLHYYWNDIREQVIMLDWNIGRWNPQKTAPESIQFDMLQFSSRALHHLFTGVQAPGSAVVGPNRPEDIENSPRHYKASYSYDVQKRLNISEIAFLEKALDGGFSDAQEMGGALTGLLDKRL